MAYARRNTSEDIRANRAWTADAAADLASIPAKHGDLAFEDTNNLWYIWNGTGWESIGVIYGTWSPNIAFASGSIGVTYSVQTGTYAKIGRQVVAQGSITLSASGSSTGVAEINNLPFASANTTSVGGVILSQAANLVGLTGTPSGRIDSNDTSFSLFQWGATGTTALDDTNFSNTSQLVFTVVYLTEA